MYMYDLGCVYVTSFILRTIILHNNYVVPRKIYIILVLLLKLFLYN